MNILIAVGLIFFMIVWAVTIMAPMFINDSKEEKED